MSNKYQAERSSRKVAESFGWEVSFLCDTVQFAVGELASSPNGWDLAICSFESLMADLIEGRFRSVVEWLKLGKPAGSSLSRPTSAQKKRQECSKLTIGHLEQAVLCRLTSRLSMTGWRELPLIC